MSKDKTPAVAPENVAVHAAKLREVIRLAKYAVQQVNRERAASAEAQDAPEHTRRALKQRRDFTDTAVADLFDAALELEKSIK